MMGLPDFLEEKQEEREREAERQDLLVCLRIELCLRTCVFTELLLLSDFWGGFILHASHVNLPARQNPIWGGSKLAFLAS